jgi:sugar phosphate isomerase/epimerase
MQLGIFAKTFARPTVEDIFDAVAQHGFECIQFNFSCCGLPTLPDEITPALANRIRTALQQRSLSMAAVSGTCNLIHPDPKERADCLRRLRALIAACPQLGTNVVTLCTGTRDRIDMWRGHPENRSASAWQDLLHSLENILPIAEQNQVFLGVEPEPGNVINSAPSARRLLDEVRSPVLKIIFDAANLVAEHARSEHDRVLSQAVELLGPDIVLAHGKNLSGLDHSDALTILRQAGFNGPLILHGMEEKQLPEYLDFFRAILQQAGRFDPTPLNP